MPSEIFLTGATGFIGSGLLQHFLEITDARIHLLIRPRRDRTPRDRIDRVLAELFPDDAASSHRDRIEVLEGDLTLPDLGLSRTDHQRLTERITHIIHCAAAARFDLKLEEARRINVGGTERILTLAQQCPNLERMDYIGTAYVAGRRQGLIREDELDEGQEHHNTYERSKMEAEGLVRKHWSRLPIAIFRPSIVIAEASTGRISRHSAFFRVLEMIRQGALKALPGDTGALLDLVPLDYCIRALEIISRDVHSLGRCYHLTAGIDNLTSLGRIRDLTGHHFGGEPFTILPGEQFDALMTRHRDGLSEEEQTMLEEIGLYRPYLAGGPKFDTTHTSAALRNRGLEVPPLDDYFPRIVSYLMRHQT